MDNKDNIRKIIREAILSEIIINPLKPDYYEFHKLGDKEIQCIFESPGNDTYVVSFMKTTLNISDVKFQNIFNNIKSSEFIAINFFPYKSNPNNKETFLNSTNDTNFISLAKCLSWVILEYSKNNNSEQLIVVPSEKRRANIFKDIANQLFSLDYNIYGYENFDSEYDQKQLLLIKK